MIVPYLLVAIAGATTIGSQILLYAYVAQYYPLAIRSTGIGWASAWGASWGDFRADAGRCADRCRWR